MPNFVPAAHRNYFIPDIEVHNNNNGVLRFKKYPKFGPILPSANLAKAVNVTKHEVPAYIPHAEPLAPLPRPPSPGHKRLLVSGAPNVKIGNVHTASTRRRKAKKSKKSRKHRR
jgi:hypothetical protein